MLTPEVRRGIEELLAGARTVNIDTIRWLKRQLEHDDWDQKIERMGGGRKARDARMKPFFDAACSVTAFDMHVQLTTDGRERGLWIRLDDESKARAERYDAWAEAALDVFCQLTGIGADAREKFRLSMSMGEFKNLSNSKVNEAALLEWPKVKELHAAIGREIAKHEDGGPRCEACEKRIGDGDDDCGACVNCRLPLCVHDDRYDVNHDGNVCPRACNAVGPHGDICDDTIAHDTPHRWEDEP